MEAAVWREPYNEWESEKVVQLLLEAGADPNDSREGQGTVLQAASYRGSESTVKRLLGANADVNLQCEWDFDSVRHPQN